MKKLEHIQNLLVQGENSSVEFKRQEVHPDAIAREMVAFANTRGGTILIGVDDTGTIAGIDDGINWEERIANIARHNIVPALTVEYYEVSVNNRCVGVIDVPKGPDKPYQTSKNFYFIRIGSTTRTATQGELMRMFQHAGMFHYDLTPVEKTSIKDLNIPRISSYFHRNYPIHGARIRIRQFADRIEFISPGRLPNTVTIEKLKSGVSYAVNPVILKFMENLRYIDKLGRGIPMVCLEAAKLGAAPVFEETGEEFQVTLPFQFH